MKTQHPAFNLSPGSDVWTLTCQQCDATVRFTPNHRPEEMDRSQTEHRKHCVLRACCVCKTVIATGEPINPLLKDVSHGYCAKDYAEAMRQAELFNARTGDLRAI